MSFIATRDGACFKCHTEYKAGDELKPNGYKTKADKDYWCKLGAACQGAMQTKGTASLPPTQPQKTDLDQLVENFSKIDESERFNNVVYKMIGDYISVRRKCESVGITEPAVIGMILNNVVRDRQ